MRFALHTDHCLRVLIHLGVHEGRLTTVLDMARAYDIPWRSVATVVRDLRAMKLVEIVRGREGGVRLGCPASAVNLGAVVRRTEGVVAPVDCHRCIIEGVCGLPPILVMATEAFFGVLDRYTLADLMANANPLRRLLSRGLH